MLRRRWWRLRSDLRNIRREYPRSIWALAGGTFINSFGGSMVFPLFTLYFTQKFGISVAQAGLLIVLFTVGGLIGGPLGGWLADRFGRKGVMMFSLAAEAAFSMGMALAPSLPLLILAIIGFGPDGCQCSGRFVGGHCGFSAARKTRRGVRLNSRGGKSGRRVWAVGRRRAAGAAAAARWDCARRCLSAAVCDRCADQFDLCFHYLAAPARNKNRKLRCSQRRLRRPEAPAIAGFSAIRRL